MPSIINASSSSTGLLQSADASGILQLQSNGVTGLTVGSGGLLTAANGIVMNTMTLGSPITGEFEYDGKVPYFTPLGTQRGIVPSMQYYRLNSGVVGSNATGAQSILGVGVTLSASTVYAFEANYVFTRTAGTTSHTLSTLFGGTATINNILYSAIEMDATGSFGVRGSQTAVGITAINTAAATVVSTSMGSASQVISLTIFGTVSVNAGGTFIPQYSLSAAPGGAYTIAPGSYFCIYPIGAAGSNTSVGTWA